MRRLLAHEFGHSWYLGERVVRQITEEVVVPPARPPNVYEAGATAAGGCEDRGDDQRVLFVVH